MIDWLLRLLKGALIGTGFILPGVSGGALAAVFGLYQRIIDFLAHITKNFIENVLFFIPVGIGALAGMVLLSRPLSYFMTNYEAQALWFFVGAIIGTVPALWKEANKLNQRKAKHIVILLLAFALGIFLLAFIEGFIGGSVPLNIFTWFAAGVLIALGVLVPGLSPSNFLVFFGFYTPMVEAFKNIDLSVLLPLFIGVFACLLLFSKLIEKLFEKAYTALFHGILGLVFASTVMIIPFNYNYLQPAALICLATLAAGTALGWWMSKLEK